MLGVRGADERDVVDLGRHVLAGVAGDGGLELAGEVGVLRVADVAALDLLHRRRAVEDLVGRDAGDGGAEDHAGRVAAGLEGVEADGLELLPDGRHVLDADPVELDVLPVGDVGRAACVGRADLTDRAELVGRQLAAVDAHPHHEVLGVELLRLEGAGLPAVETRLALRVEPHPAEPSAEVGPVDGGEAALGVDVLDARPDVERVVVLLGLLVLVQRLVVAESPLALAALLARAPGAAGAGRRSGGGAGRGAARRGGSGGGAGWGCHGKGAPGEWRRTTRRGFRQRCREGVRRPRARLGSAGQSGGVPGTTDHAARATEVHVAADHEVHRRCGADHGSKSHKADGLPTNSNLVM